MELPRLKEWRERRGYTQKGLSAESGVSERSIASYEVGHNARPNTAYKLARVLEITPEDLMDLEDFVESRRSEPPKAIAPSGPGRRKEQETSKYLRILRAYLFRLNREWRQHPPTSDEVKYVATILQLLDEEGVFAEQETPGSMNEQMELDLIRGFIETLVAAAKNTEMNREFERIVEGADWSQQQA